MKKSTSPPGRAAGILLIIVIAQFVCTSLWFAGNAALADLISVFGIDPNALGTVTSAVQLGFITGTLVFAFLMLADRFSPSSLFFVNALAGALFNLAIIFGEQTYLSILLLRFATGFFLAGIYPVGMKIAADYFEKGLGKALGFLLGALVLGTAFPHLLKYMGHSLPWKAVFITTSALAVAGGLIMLLVPDGPYRKKSEMPDPSAFFKVFRNREFRSAAFGYFGHMWELYAFWAFLPVMLDHYKSLHTDQTFSTSLYAFLVIASGSVACAVGGQLSLRVGSRKVAWYALLTSGACCLLSPLLFPASPIVFFAFLFTWGCAVIADSPQFSSLIAQNAPADARGTALTAGNCIGFSITIVSILLLNRLATLMPVEYLFLVLAPGPMLGLVALRRAKKVY